MINDILDKFDEIIKNTPKIISEVHTSIIKDYVVINRYEIDIKNDFYS